MTAGKHVHAEGIGGEVAPRLQRSAVDRVVGAAEDGDGAREADARTGTEVFTLDEGPVTISFPASLCAASLEDLKQYLDIFYRKACRLTDDPVDAMDTTRFSKRDLKIAAAE